MLNALRDQTRSLFQSILYSPAVSTARPQIVHMVRRMHNHVFNCSTCPTSNGEDWLLSQMPDTGTFLDVGFNKGSWSRGVLAQHPGAFVHAFDPCLDVLEVVEKLNLDRFSFNPIALASKPGVATFHDYGDLHEMNSLADRVSDLGASVKPATYDVTVATLDDWAKENDVSFVDVLKLDAEGFDLDIMEGASELFAERRVDLVVFEFASGWIATRRTLFEANQFLTGLGYSVYRLFPRFLVPYEYSVHHEGAGLVGYFVALSPRAAQRQRYPTRDLVL